MLPTPPKGSLEELFRHHLLESAAAAVPPRPQAWEQLENSLLLAQNTKYRRRLAAYRWAVAASLLLAATAGGGWWHSQQLASTPGLTQATGVTLPAGAGRGAASARLQPASPVAATRPAGPNQTGATGPEAGAAGSGPAASASAVSPATPSTIAQPATSPRAALGFAAATHSRANRLKTGASLAATGAGSRHRATGRLAGAATAGASAAVADGATASLGGVSARNAARRAPTRPAARPELPAAPDLTLLADATPTPEAGLLGLRLAHLQVPADAGLNPTLREVVLAASLPLPQARSWQYGLTYAASVYQPNIDFARDDADYNTALGANSAALTRSAAAEYRRHLRAGLGQRLSLWASRRLGSSRFGLRTGLELTQQQAQSATSAAFVGEQVPDFSSYGPVAPPPPGAAASLRTTTFQYRTVSIPLELGYGRPARPGVSLYGRVGGVLTALFNVRSEVEGNAEASRTYTLGSINSPYRHYSASVRGGLGMRYQPAGHAWAFNLGPVAEAGVLSLNLDPTQDFWSQQRPYSVGLEAGLELGRAPKLP